MGLSSSQARLLNLTRRMHDIEYKAQNLEAQKLQMANESKQVYQEYENALNKQKVQFKTISADGSAQYDDADLAMIMNEGGYKVSICVNGEWKDFDKDSIDTATNTILVNTTYGPDDQSIKVSSTSYKIGDIVNLNGDICKVYQIAAAEEEPSKIRVRGYIAHDHTLAVNNKQVLRNLVEAGFIVFKKPTNQKDEAGETIYADVNIATDTNLQEVSDDTELKKAEAKYEADMRKINQKDKKFDTDLAALDNERTAIKSEMETLKTVAKDNVDRTFKLFS